ncbi:DUF4845 domain-containing protein [Pseudohongiella nitratireducens]|uniref:DUF4845 domain-containing protein n=1 Tax=Pseudohongiella nitratireducens TaxID=1768907 RepID=UPI0030EED8FD|tara:strand:+ start:11379 stop:11756 length:378 start_codon:yes stop_codon:yes gene_type:complete
MSVWKPGVDTDPSLISRALPVLLLILVVPAIYIVYRITPAYLDYHYMVTTARQMVHAGEAERMSGSQILNDFSANMRLNHIDTFQAGYLRIERDSGRTMLIFDYSIDVDILMGWHLTIDFQETVP